jgi:two-component system, OmpR family, response regulator
MLGVEVALVHWPRDHAERDRLARAMLPRLLLVPDGERPPTTGDPMEDWIRLPADERDVATRLRTLSERAARSFDETVVVDDRCLRRSTLTVPLSPAEAAFARLLVSAAGQVVSRAVLAEAIWDRDADPRARALDDIAYRLRRRIGTLGLEVVSARGRGFALHMLSPAVTAAVE